MCIIDDVISVISPLEISSIIKSVCAFKFEYIYTHSYTCLYVYVCLCLSINICMCIYVCMLSSSRHS